MGAPQYEQAGADIGGTGTTNTIPRWTGPSTLGDSVITQSGSNIGIGTASPLAQFTLGGIANSTTKMGFQAASTEVGSVTMNSATGEQRITAGFTAWGGFQTFYTNGLERARIDSAGNAGIGVTPISPLHVKGNATNTDGILTLTPNTGGRNHQVQSLQASSLFRIFDQSAGASRLEIDINGNISAATTGGTFNASTSGAGLKLPATPGNTDPNTIDCYADGGTAGAGGKTFAVADASGAGLALTVTFAQYIQVGKLVVVQYDITYPATANASNAALTIPQAAPAQWQAGSVAFQSPGAGFISALAPAVFGTALNFWANNTQQTNANLSNKRIILTVSYFMA